MEKISLFCKNVNRILLSTDNVQDFFATNTYNFDIGTCEVRRLRIDNNGNSIFTFQLSHGNDLLLNEELEYMETIERFYPGLFSWRFDGHHLECIATVPMKSQYLGIYTRYGSIQNFIKQLRKRLITILKYRNYTYTEESVFIQPEIIATGSINRNTNLYCVDVIPGESRKTILINATLRNTREIVPKSLDMKFWVKEINPDYYKLHTQTRNKRYPLTKDIFSKYPKAIQNLAARKTKGNHGRFILATYFLGVHTERDAKHQLLTVLSDAEREHIVNGNCKGQWRAIIARNYPPPSAKTLLEYEYAETIYECVGLGMEDENNGSVE